MRVRSEHELLSASSYNTTGTICYNNQRRLSISNFLRFKKYKKKTKTLRVLEENQGEYFYHLGGENLSQTL